MANDELGSPSARDFSHQDTLLGAIKNGEVDIVVDLLKRGVAGPNEADEKGSTPLHFACLVAEEAEGHADNQDRVGVVTALFQSYKPCWRMGQT